MTTENNLLNFREELKLNKRDFAEKIGIHEGNYAKMERGQLTIGPATILKFQKAFPTVNSDWWAFKKGEKYLSKSDINTYKANNRGNLDNAKSIGKLFEGTENDKFKEISPGRYRMKVRLVPEYAYAGYLSGFSDPVYVDELPMHEVTVTIFHKGNYLAFEVAGDSMDNGLIESIPDGTIVTCREISRDQWKSKFNNNRWPNFVIVHKTEGVLIKRIVKQDLEAGIITLHSLNPDKNTYPDFDINIDDIHQIFNVVKRELP